MEYSDTLETEATDMGYCLRGHDIDAGRCDCTDEEREEPTLPCQCREDSCTC
jgi:hypothetical protein